MNRELVERLRGVYENLTPGAIDRADLDGMAFTVSDAIAALSQPIARANVDREELITLIREHLASTDYPVSSWELKFADAIHNLYTRRG